MPPVSAAWPGRLRHFPALWEDAPSRTFRRPAVTIRNTAFGALSSRRALHRGLAIWMRWKLQMRRGRSSPDVDQMTCNRSDPLPDHDIDTAPGHSACCPTSGTAEGRPH
ncbi:MAG: hypothetical protein ACLUPV_05265 [Bilophila wadsworthia]